MEGISVQETLFLFLGGLGIFLFGIKYMGDGLEKAAGDRLRLILDRLTTNPVMGVIAGILTTVLIQSSSATTVLVVGFVNAGLMTLRQAIGVIMGANIGTTVTAFIIGLKIEDYALPIIALRGDTPLLSQILNTCAISDRSFSASACCFTDCKRWGLA